MSENSTTVTPLFPPILLQYQGKNKQKNQTDFQDKSTNILCSYFPSDLTTSPPLIILSIVMNSLLSEKSTHFNQCLIVPSCRLGYKNLVLQLLRILRYCKTRNCYTQPIANNPLCTAPEILADWSSFKIFHPITWHQPQTNVYLPTPGFLIYNFWGEPMLKILKTCTAVNRWHLNVHVFPPPPDPGTIS